MAKTYGNNTGMILQPAQPPAQNPTSFFDTQVNLPVVGSVSYLTLGIALAAGYFLFVKDGGKKK